MSEPRFIAVIDIGKTNAKVALVDLRSCTEIKILKQANKVLHDGPYPHYDVEGIWQFIINSLRELNNIDAISITTHGATAALVDAEGNLVLPILDYEYDIFSEAYKNTRPIFAETGSPLLPLGLNLGAQLHWLENTFPKSFTKTKYIMLYPQYWAWRLTGIAASEVTSLGCHTDLWCPARNDYSTLVDSKNWRRLMPPLFKAVTLLGTVKSDIGLQHSAPVAVGIHDSNASLVSHLKIHEKPFAVVSTGTWVVSMAVGSALPQLDEARDTLINVNLFGDLVPSARFMGGREFEIITKNLDVEFSKLDIHSVLRDGILLLPSVVPGSGPFPHQYARWTGSPTPAQKQVATSFYLALMTITCLSLINADGDIIVEGPFSENQLYCKMLATASGRIVSASDDSKSGTTIGAALLLSKTKPVEPKTTRYSPESSPDWSDYIQKWLESCTK
jgi:sugar (pentulose or hexulose) kinase